MVKFLVGNCLGRGATGTFGCCCHDDSLSLVCIYMGQKKITKRGRVILTIEVLFIFCLSTSDRLPCLLLTLLPSCFF